MTRTLRLLTICFAMVLGLTTVGLSAAQANTIATGTIRSNDNNDPLSGINVTLYASESNANTHTSPLTTGLVTDAQGEYSVDLPDNQYWVQAVDPTGAYRTQVEDVFVSAGDSDLGDIYLDRATGTISGKVVDHDAQPFEDECVELDFYDATGTDSDSPVGTTYTNDDGTYSTELPVGTYRINAFTSCGGNLPNVWFGGVDFSSAVDVAVTDQDVTPVPPFKLDAGASITGVVDRAGPAGHLAGILVESFTTDPDLGGYPDSHAYTDSNGHYVLRGQQVGLSYKLRFSDPANEFAGKWYTDPTTAGATFAAGTLLQVTSDNDVSLNTTILAAIPDAGGTKVISGLVVDKDNAPVFGITVDAGPATTTTRRDGSYSFVAAQLPEEGDYTLYFEDTFGDRSGQPRYLPQYYFGKDTYSTATPVTVTSAAHAVTTVKMVSYGKATGMVAVPAGLPHRDLSVDVFNLDDEYVGSVDTKNSGAYTVPFLPPGGYRLRFVGSAHSNDDYVRFIGQYYKNKSTFASSTPVNVLDGGNSVLSTVTMTDQLTALALPKISGTAKKSKTIKASTGTWNRLTATVFTYQWYRGSSAISGATKSSYKLGSSDVGKKVKVKVTATNRYGDFRTGSAFSSATGTVKK